MDECDANIMDMIDLITVNVMICVSTTWLKCALWGTIPSYAVSGVWERRKPQLLLNK